MTHTQAIRGLVLSVLTIALLVVPALSTYGQLWIIASVCAMTLYEGIRARVVYGCMALLFVVELLYGGDPGVMLIPYCLIVLFLLGLRRFVSLPAWAASEGWQFSDGIRAVVTPWLVSMSVILVAVVVGDILYDYAHVWERMRTIASPLHILELLISCAVTVVVWRRASVPFRREIHFGT